MTATSDINRERIAATEAVIRPHIRRTPLVQADLADFGPPAAPVTLKLAAGAAVDAPASGPAADSLAPRRVGELMFPIARAHVERVVLVSDDAIRQAQAALWSRLRLVAEPGGAAAFAALLSGRYRPSPGERVAVLVCGANTTAVSFES